MAIQDEFGRRRTRKQFPDLLYHLAYITKQRIGLYRERGLFVTVDDFCEIDVNVTCLGKNQRIKCREQPVPGELQNVRNSGPFL